MIAALRDIPNKWAVILWPLKVDPVLTVVAMMELLSTSQLDRHGADDETVPLGVGPGEATAAAHMAAALVQFFRSGAVARQ